MTTQDRAGFILAAFFVAQVRALRLPRDGKVRNLAKLGNPLHYN
jgi:hypothetical protein